MFKRIFATNLLVGMGLTLVLGVGSAAEGPGAESVAEDPVAKLVRIEKEVKVKEQERSDGAAVKGRVGSVGTALKKGDRVSVPEAGIAVIQYYDGCLYTVEGSTKGTEYEVNHEQCICQENLDASKHSRHDAIAELRDINVEAMVENQETRKRGGERYVPGTEGMELKGGDRVLVPDVLKGEEDSAMVEYYFGCDHKVTDKDEPYTVDAEECCLALAARPEPVVGAPPEPALPAAAALAPAIIGGIIGVGAIVDDDDDDPLRSRSALSPFSLLFGPSAGVSGVGRSPEDTHGGSDCRVLIQNGGELSG